MKRLMIILTMLAAIIVAPTLAFSQEFQSENYKPRPSQKDNILNVSGSSVLPHLSPSLGFTTHYADDSLQVIDADTGNIESRVVSHRLKGEYQLSLGLLDRLEVGASMPVSLYQTGEKSSQVGLDYMQHTALSDLRLSTKLQILNPENNQGNVGVSLRGDVSLPTGDEESYNSSGKVRGGPTLIADWQTGHWHLAANVGYQFRSKKRAMNYLQEDGLDYGLGVEVPLWSQDISFVSSVFGTSNLAHVASTSKSTSDSPAEALGGFRFYATEAVIVQAGGSAGISPGVGTPDYRVFASVNFRPRDHRSSTPEVTQTKTPTSKPEPKPEPDPKPKPEEPEEEPKVITLSQMVHFDTDKAKLKPEGKRKLDEVASVLKKNPQLTEIRVEGHTDSRASHEYNRLLSIRRAIAVETYLMKKGVNKKRLKLVGYGETDPIAPNDHPQKGMAENRRAEFRVLEVDGEKVENPTMTVIIRNNTEESSKDKSKVEEEK